MQVKKNQKKTKQSGGDSHKIIDRRGRAKSSAGDNDAKLKRTTTWGGRVGVSRAAQEPKLCVHA